MITITYNELADEFQPSTITASYELPDHATSTDVISTLVSVLRAAGYMDGSIHSSLTEVAMDLAERVEVSHKSIQEQQCDN